jgi:4-amino-4-deoxy-L-arabinose transferase-like glycosyltransferase
MGEGRSGMRRGVFAAWVALIVGVTLLQSAVHLGMVLGGDRIGTLVDLDRSNGIPDLVSTLALAAAAAGAISIARDTRVGRRLAPAALAAVLVGLTLADLVHDGPHPRSATGWLVMAMVVATGILLALIAVTSGPSTRATLTIAGSLLVASFLVNGLDQYDQWFERERPDPVVEYQIVVKEALELVGWSLVALALWDEAVRRRERRETTTVPASRARAASRRRVA